MSDLGPIGLLDPISSAFTLGSTIGRLFGGRRRRAADGAGPGSPAALAQLVAATRDNNRLLTQLRDLQKGVRHGPPAPVRAEGPPRTVVAPTAPPPRPQAPDWVSEGLGRIGGILGGISRLPPELIDPNSDFWMRVRDPSHPWRQPMFPGIPPIWGRPNVGPRPDSNPPRAQPGSGAGGGGDGDDTASESFRTGGRLEDQPPRSEGGRALPGAADDSVGDQGRIRSDTAGGCSSSAAAATGPSRSDADSRSRANAGGGSAACTTTIVIGGDQVSRLGNRKVQDSMRRGGGRGRGRRGRTRAGGFEPDTGYDVGKPKRRRAAPSPAQIAARRRFAERARAGEFRRTRRK